MGRLFIPAENSIDGPWLLDQESLEKLDDILVLVSAKLTEAHLKKNQNISERDQVKKKIEVKLTSKDLRENIDTSIKGILKDSKIKDFKPAELFIHIEHGAPDNEFRAVITAVKDGNLDYLIRCSDESLQEDIKYEFDKWIDNYKPKKLAQWWWALYEPVLIFGGIALFILWAAIYEGEVYEGLLKNQAHHLLDSGVTQTNMHRAVEIALKLQTKYQPSDFVSKETVNLHTLKILIISLIVYLVWIFCPRTTLGIGKDDGWLKFYKFWMYFALVFFPVSVVLPKLIELFYSIF